MNAVAKLAIVAMFALSSSALAGHDDHRGYHDHRDRHRNSSPQHGHDYHRGHGHQDHHSHRHRGHRHYDRHRHSHQRRTTRYFFGYRSPQLRLHFGRHYAPRCR